MITLICDRCKKPVDGATSELLMHRQSWLVTAYCHDGTDQIEVLFKEQRVERVVFKAEAAR